MDYKFLNKVLDQIVSETSLDYDEGRMYTPFTITTLPLTPYHSYHYIPPLSYLYSPFPLFSKHCKNIYGLNEDEIKYVWNEYKKIIKDKIENG